MASERLNNPADPVNPDASWDTTTRSARQRARGGVSRFGAACLVAAGVLAVGTLVYAASTPAPTSPLLAAPVDPAGASPAAEVCPSESLEPVKASMFDWVRCLFRLADGD